MGGGWGGTVNFQRGERNEHTPEASGPLSSFNGFDKSTRVGCGAGRRREVRVTEPDAEPTNGELIEWTSVCLRLLIERASLPTNVRLAASSMLRLLDLTGSPQAAPESVSGWRARRPRLPRSGRGGHLKLVR